MDIIFYHPTFDTQWWIEALRKAIPQARVRAWKSGDNDSADYALVWHPPVEMLAGRDLKAVFALGAGVDSILSKLQAHPEMLNPSVPLFRLEDTGMGEQMQEYAVSQVLHWFRRFDDYQALKNQAKWQPLPEYSIYPGHSFLHNSLYLPPHFHSSLLYYVFRLMKICVLYRRQD